MSGKCSRFAERNESRDSRKACEKPGCRSDYVGPRQRLADASPAAPGTRSGQGPQSSAPSLVAMRIGSVSSSIRSAERRSPDAYKINNSLTYALKGCILYFGLLRRGLSENLSGEGIPEARGRRAGRRPDPVPPRRQPGSSLAGHPCGTRRKIEKSLLNSLFSGNLPALLVERFHETNHIERSDPDPRQA
jgi:hypothetical protein